MRFRNIVLLLVSALVLMAIAKHVQIYFYPEISNTRVTFYENGEPTQTQNFSTFLEQASTSATKQAVLEFEAKASIFGNRRFHFIVDDCVEAIQVDEEGIDISGIPSASLCDIHNGFVIDLPVSSTDVPSHVRVEISDVGGGFKASVFAGAFRETFRDATLMIALLLPLAVFWQRTFLRSKTAGYGAWSVGFSLVFYIALALFFYRYMGALPHEHSHDFYGHMDYLRFVLTHLRLPEASQCYECYQPPVYYLFAAGAFTLGKWVGLVDPMMAVKAISLPVYLALVSIYVSFVRRLNVRPWASLFGFSLFLLWPLGVVKATDFTADILAACGVFWSFLWTFKWYDTPRIKFVFKALIIAAITMWIKSTAIVAFGMFGVATLMLLYERRITFKSLVSWRMLCIAAGCLLLGFSYLAHLSTVSTDDPASTAMVFYTMSSNTSLWFADDTLAYYLVFPFETFLKQPFLNTFHDETGRKYFWNAFFKTVVLGEWEWQPRKLAMAMNVTFLLMVIYSLISGGAALLKPVRFAARPLALHGVAIGLLLLMLVVFRISQPAGCNQDVRYIYAIIPLFCLCYTALIQDHISAGRRIRAYAGASLGLLFMVLSIGFFIAHYGWLI
jgi:hypothetical protein